MHAWQASDGRRRRSRSSSLLPLPQCFPPPNTAVTACLLPDRGVAPCACDLIAAGRPTAAHRVRRACRIRTRTARPPCNRRTVGGPPVPDRALAHSAPARARARAMTPCRHAQPNPTIPHRRVKFGGVPWEGGSGVTRGEMRQVGPVLALNGVGSPHRAHVPHHRTDKPAYPRHTIHEAGSG
jgi:hypothetical protein